MEERTKQRLVGVLVFVGALFIVLPFLFHNAHPNANTSASTAQKTADANSAVTVSMPAENNTAPAAKPQAVAINDNNAVPSSDQNAPAAMPDAAVPAPQSAAAPDATAAAPQAPTATPGAVAVPPAPSTPAQPANAPAAMPASAATTVGGDAAVPSNNPTKFPSMAPSDAAVPSTPASPAGTGPQAMPAAPANGVDANPAATTNGQQNTSLNKKPAITADAAAPSEDKPRVAVSAPEAALAKADIKKPAAHHVTAESAAIAEGWTVQLGAFSDRSNATHLMANLREHHFHVYSRQVARGEPP